MSLPPEFRALTTAFDRAVRLGEPYSVDLEITRPDGSTRWIVARGEVESWENGEVASLSGTVQEITERKRIERETAVRENRYRSLVHATAQIVWITNAEGEQVGNPPSWQAFTGQSDEEVRGFGWADAIHPEDREQAVSAWRHAVCTGQTYQVEERVRRKDGAYRSMACARSRFAMNPGQLSSGSASTPISPSRKSRRKRAASRTSACKPSSTASPTAYV